MVTVVVSNKAPAAARLAFMPSWPPKAFMASGESKSMRAIILLSSSFSEPAKINLALGSFQRVLNILISAKYLIIRNNYIT
jgi:hypothetical protein